MKKNTVKLVLVTVLVLSGAVEMAFYSYWQPLYGGLIIPVIAVVLVVWYQLHKSKGAI